ncbi:unnamed protein product [Discula destructiva]
MAALAHGWAGAGTGTSTELPRLEWLAPSASPLLSSKGSETNQASKHPGIPASSERQRLVA